MADRRPKAAPRAATRRPSALIDTRVIYCGDNLDQLRKLPDGCTDLIYISQIRRGGDPPFNSNRNYEVFWGAPSEPRSSASGPLARFDDRQKGFFVSFDYSADALREIDAFFRKHKKVIVALTVREILDEEIAKKLA